MENKPLCASDAPLDSTVIQYTVYVQAQDMKTCADCRFPRSHLPTAELQEYVDVFLVFEMMREFNHMLVWQGFVQLDLVRDLPRRKKKKSINMWTYFKTLTARHWVHAGYSVYAENTVERDRAYLVPLVWFGHPALWNHLHCIHFVGGEVCHLVASSKAALGGDKHEDQLKAAGWKPAMAHKQARSQWPRDQYI